MRLSLIVLLILISTGFALAAPADRDRRMDGYLGIWADDRNVTAATVSQLYARRVVYYGRTMSNTAVFRDKLAFVRQWPRRRYAAVPGSVTNDCTSSVDRCRVKALLAWHRADASGGRAQSGTNSVSLALIREGGVLKIASESGSAMR